MQLSTPEHRVYVEPIPRDVLQGHRLRVAQAREQALAEAAKQVTPGEALRSRILSTEDAWLESLGTGTETHSTLALDASRLSDESFWAMPMVGLWVVTVAGRAWATLCRCLVRVLCC